MLNNTINESSLPGSATAIKIVDIKPGASFAANGKTYHVSDTFTIGRLEKVTLLEEEVMMLSDAGSCHSIMLQAMKAINEYKPGEAYTMLYNKIESDRKNAKLLHYAIRSCAAYINYEGEPMGYLTDEQIITKINDWSAEGLDVRPFMIFAAAVFKEHLAPYKQDMLNILKEAKSISEAISMETATTTSTKNQSSGGQK